MSKKTVAVFLRSGCKGLLGLQRYTSTIVVVKIYGVGHIVTSSASKFFHNDASTSECFM